MISRQPLKVNTERRLISFPPAVCGPFIAVQSSGRSKLLRQDFCSFYVSAEGMDGAAFRFLTRPPP